MLWRKQDTFDGVDAVFPEDKGVLVRQDSAREDGLQKESLDVV